MKRVFCAGCFFSLLFFMSTAVCQAESFRTHKTHIVSLSAENQKEQSLQTGINDSIGVCLPDDLMFFEGIEVKVQIPPAVANWRDSVALAAYDGVTPVPSASKIDYSGKRIYIQPLPSKVNWIMQIPLRYDNSLKDGPYVTKMNVIPEISGHFVFLRFMPVMKGVPEETLESVLSVSVKPVLIDKGRLVLSVKTPSSAKTPFVVLIDDKVTELPADNSILLDAGVHNVCIQSDEYRNEVSSVYIDRARTTVCEISLKSLMPTVSISVPDNVDMFFDDKKIDGTAAEFEVSEGEHRLRFLMGSYEIIRSLNAEKGKSYSVNLSVDLEITAE
ncbi:MAG: hypothetical protein MR662_02080 [Treponema porcinum]|uniref:hypothetical protein n=2 Tax=Treponema porcinum TaxID=261392 RepID=UPI002353C9B1|nr:hypothetical protein [Treponema porcinum]MCI6179269.1 hypothetical protein [Treponema porcinum]MCI6722433.1 hypothetical protein [Treponema porcinum]MCI6815310.1 hypothetical protein [Treponema porcinum]MCI7080858.1 hypothetical protein [Treponema porcinum]MCI7533452.1 hypothetical protein [Treponema porcinum]